MSFISINSKQVSGALFPEKSDRELYVAKGQKSPVIMTGYLASGQVKGEDGEYHYTEYGRLPIEAAKASEDRLVLSVAGGALRGVLFKSKEGQKFDYSGNIEAGDGMKYAIFGRKVKGERGTFISISSADKEPMEDSGKKSSKSKEPDNHPVIEDDDVPF